MALVYDDPLTTSNVRIRSGTGSFSSLTDEVKRVNAQPRVLAQVEDCGRIAPGRHVAFVEQDQLLAVLRRHVEVV